MLNTSAVLNDLCELPVAETELPLRAPVAVPTAASAATARSLFGIVYPQLKSMAHRELGRVSSNTLDTTALVHELYLKLCGGRTLEFAEPAQFFAYAARAMRHILLDRAYRRIRVKVGGDATHVELTEAVDAVGTSPQLALQLDAALTRLEATDARAARVVELHYFAGLGLDQVADIVGISRRTVDRDWRFARAFLMEQMG